MASLRNFVSTAICVLFFISTAAAIKCYVCNSHFTPDCASTEKVLANEFQHDCDAYSDRNKQYSYCRKIEQEIPADVIGGDGHTRVIRQCGYYNASTNACTKAGMVNGGRQIVCTCDTDGCNGASNLGQQLGFVAAIVFTVALVGQRF